MYRSDFKLEKSTYYVLDASGNVMATYDKILDNENSRVYFKLEERHIYGSSRVGVRSSDLDLLPLPTQNYSMKSVHYSIGSRTYELSNHLGNVLSVISDKVIPYFEGGGIAEMRADIRVAQDYSPFGVTLDGRNFVVDERYRYGFNGHEKDDEIAGSGNHLSWGDYGMYPRIGRRWNVDPQWKRLPGQSPYSVNNNNPIFLHDPDGKFAVPPALVAGALGAVSEVISQLAINYFDKGYDMATSFSKLDYSDIAVAAGSAAFWGFFDGGITTFTSFIGRSTNRRILKLASKYIIETVIGAVENIAKDYFNSEDIDIGAAIGGALVEVGLGEFLPAPKHFERKANNAKRTMERTKDQMDRANFSQLSTRKQNKIKNKHDKASSDYKKNKLMQRAVESIEDGTAKALGNKAQDYIKNKNEGITIEYNTNTKETKVY